MRVWCGFAAVTAAAIVNACVSDSTAISDGGPDASSDVGTDASVDAAKDGSVEAAPACKTSAPFAAPVAISELNTAAHETAAELTHDELTVYFSIAASADAGPSGPSTVSSLATASRASRTVPFGGITFLTLDSPAGDFVASPTGDNLTLYFSSLREGGVGDQDLWLATRTTTAGAFANVSNATTLNSVPADGQPYVLPDGLTIYFSSQRGGSYDLYRATRTPTSAFSVDTSAALGLVNASATHEFSPVVTPDELTLYFASTRLHSGFIPNIFVAKRASTADPFGAPIPLAEITDIGGPTWVSDDGCRLYLSSDKAGSADIYVATKPAN